MLFPNQLLLDQQGSQFDFFVCCSFSIFRPPADAKKEKSPKGEGGKGEELSTGDFCKWDIKHPVNVKSHGSALGT